MTPSNAAPRRHLPTSPFQVAPVKPVVTFELMDRVSHDRYGLGRVIGVEGDGAVLVEFGDRRERIAAGTSTLHKL